MSKKNKISLYILLIAIVASIKLNAQTEPMYSQYMYNMLSINPAYAGNREALGLSVFYRNQWVDLPGAPQTKSATIDGSINDNRVGLGLQMYDDRLGVEKATGFNGTISTRIHVSSNGILSAGLSLGMMNYRADLTQVPNRFTPSDPAFSQNFNQWMTTLGAGVFYNTDKFYAGVSVPNFMVSRLSTLDKVTSSIQSISDYHFFINSGVVIDMSQDVKLKPSAMLKVVSGAPLQADINCNLWLKDVVGFGLSYRTGDAVVGMLELQANKQLRFGYAYDFTTSAMGAYNQGSHEMFLRFEFGNDRIIKSTRYF